MKGHTAQANSCLSGVVGGSCTLTPTLQRTALTLVIHVPGVSHKDSDFLVPLTNSPFPGTRIQINTTSQYTASTLLPPHHSVPDL